MSKEQDHTVLITICVLIGVVVTVTVGIVGSIYNNDKNIERDKFLIQQCNGRAYKQNVGQTDPPQYRINCDTGVQK